MGFEVKEALRRLCDEAGWSYAVFWRSIRESNQVRLVFGDVYYERQSDPPAMSGFETMDLLLKEKVSLRSGVRDGNRVPELASRGDGRLTNLLNMLMVNQVHIVGEGLIGQATLSGNHQWVFQDPDCDIMSTSEALTEMSEQFQAGIQTVAIIPILQHGVVQLGSTKMVMEDAGFVNHVKSLFHNIVSEVRSSGPSTMGEHITRKTNFAALSFSASPLEASMEKMKASFGLTCNGFCHPSLDIPTLSSKSQLFHCFPNTVQFYEGKPYHGTLNMEDSLNHPVPLGNLQPMFLPNPNLKGHLDVVQDIVAESSRAKFQSKDHESLKAKNLNGPNSITDFRSASLLNKRKYLSKSNNIKTDAPCHDESVETNNLEDATNSTEQFHRLDTVDKLPDAQRVDLNCLRSNDVSVDKKFQRMSIVETAKQEDKPFSHSLGKKCRSSVKPSNDSSECIISSNSACIRESHMSVHSENSGLLSGSSNVNDLHEILNLPVSTHQSGSDLLDMLVLPYVSCSYRSGSAEVNRLKSGSGLFECKPESTHFAFDGDNLCQPLLEANPDQLLDAIVSNTNRRTMNVGLHCKTSEVRNVDSISGSIQSFGTGCSSQAVLGSIIRPPVDIKPEIPDSGPGRSDNFVEGYVPFLSTASLFGESSESMICEGMLGGHPMRIDEQAKPSRKRTRPGENPRPRPKDRQMIQDRIKELREIVPNGAKCSIDALLEKTIKHMLFLQGVAKHVDKLKESGLPKAGSADGTTQLSEKFGGGTTWAFEVGTHSMTCPIIVEELNSPRQMLVEMLCKERGLFLEIADQIRGLGLTILKGLMEVRKDKVWARFSVEANKDVTRMEIFLSLVHLLEPSAANPLVLKGFNNTNVLHKVLYPSIPSTGFSNCVQ